ncbi:type II toxin-antitoxin system Phd/YefM family antitoxin [Roseomonas nepalensis]|uniref:Antitoxin n=1 Tax=Muricoccus nepalensis TaxID=1854500 RepID=A0A502G4W2_9PROT|nr:type II toxin-antitoxin system Phd/YefM family antitoxin [Roseomonas nepalensis]TPG55983.1 type II toxin-antitoxin system Phd/YefM family antitoxin [Roseomonas nepalensis]
MAHHWESSESRPWSGAGGTHVGWGWQPSVITRHGRPKAVVVSFEEWQRLPQIPSSGRLPEQVAA